MKQITLSILSILLLSGCSQLEDAYVTGDLSIYKNEVNNVSFQYPSNWTVVDKQTEKVLRNDKVLEEIEFFYHSVVLETGQNENIFFDYRSMSFDEYESYKQPPALTDSSIGGFLINEIIFADYPAKKYLESGIEFAGISYVIEKDGKYLLFSSEVEISKEQKLGMEEIVRSIEFE